MEKTCTKEDITIGSKWFPSEANIQRNETLRETWYIVTNISFNLVWWEYYISGNRKGVKPSSCSVEVFLRNLVKKESSIDILFNEITKRLNSMRKDF